MTILKTELNSLADLEDILLDAYFTDEESGIILKQLSPWELAALSNYYQPMEDIDTFSFRESEQRLRACLCTFLCSLPKKQQLLIKEAADVIQEI